MTFSVTPAVFAGLEKELTDSHQATLVNTPTGSDGVSRGSIDLPSANEKGTYAYDPAKSELTLTVTSGGNFLKNAILHHKVTDAIDAINKAPATPAPSPVAA
jgi:hypothetical protein